MLKNDGTIINESKNARTDLKKAATAHLRKFYINIIILNRLKVNKQVTREATCLNLFFLIENEFG